MKKVAIEGEFNTDERDEMTAEIQNFIEENWDRIAKTKYFGFNKMRYRLDLF